MAGFKFSVTAEDIEKATRSSSGACAVARAIARSRPGASHIGVNIRDIRWSEAGERYCFLTPQSIQVYIVKFDGGDPLEPFRFGLRTRVDVATRERTPAGVEVQKAHSAARRARIKAEKAPAAQKAKATAAAKKAKAKVAAVKKATAGQVHARTTKPGKAAPPRSVLGAGSRHYGQRVMRINQDGNGAAGLTGQA